MMSEAVRSEGKLHFDLPILLYMTVYALTKSLNIVVLYANCIKFYKLYYNLVTYA